MTFPDRPGLVTFDRKQMETAAEKKGTVLLTGGTGFIGSHTAKALIEAGYRVRCCIRKSSDLRWLEGLEIEFVQTDLLSAESIAEAMEGCVYVMHIAGVVKARRKEGYFRGNVEITRQLLEATLRFSTDLKKIVVISSLAASAPTVPGKPVDEDTPSAPVSQYGESKVAQEALCAEYMDRLPITIIRPPGVFGPRDTEILVFFKLMANGILSKIGFGRKTVSLIYVKDLVSGLLQAMERAESSGRTYFLANEEEYDWDQIGRITGKVMDRKYLSLPVPEFLVHVVAFFAEIGSRISGNPSTLNLEKAREITRPSWACSPARAMREIGFKQTYSLEAGFRETISWYIKHNWL